MSQNRAMTEPLPPLSSAFFRLLQPIFSASSRLPPTRTVTFQVPATRSLPGKRLLLGGRHGVNQDTVPYWRKEAFETQVSSGAADTVIEAGDIVLYPRPEDKSRALGRDSTTAATQQEAPLCKPSWLQAR